MTQELFFTMEDGTQKPIKLQAHAATKIIYRNFFKSDIESDITKVINKNDELAQNADLSFADKLAFVMAMCADGVKVSTLTIDDFYNWLGQFSPYAFLNRFGDIYQIYSGQTVTTSEPKKADAPQSEK